MAPLCYAPQSAGPVLVLRHSRARAVEGMCRPCRRVGFHNFRLYARRKKTDDSSDPTSSKKKLAELREDRERLEANMLEMGVMGIQKAFQGRDSDKNEENAQGPRRPRLDQLAELKQVAEKYLNVRASNDEQYNAGDDGQESAVEVDKGADELAGYEDSENVEYEEYVYYDEEYDYDYSAIEYYTEDGAEEEGAYEGYESGDGIDWASRSAYGPAWPDQEAMESLSTTDYLEDYVYEEYDEVSAEDLSLHAYAHQNGNGHATWEGDLDYDAAGGYSEAGAEVEVMNFVFVSAEVAPWSKTGGLGDVAGSLPQALARLGHRVMVVTPRYLNGTDADKRFAELEFTGVTKKIEIKAGDIQTVSFYHKRMGGADIVFVDHPAFHRHGGLYGVNGRDYDDNLWRFALLSLAALEAPLNVPVSVGSEEPAPGRIVLKEVFGQRCVFIANDWHGALVPVYLAARYVPRGVFQDARTMFAVHNLAYQGVFPEQSFDVLGIPREFFSRFHLEEVDTFGRRQTINVMKAALCTADRLITVSTGYASEILTPKFGCGLQSILAKRELDMNGIVNGVDPEIWDPATDEHLDGNNYTADEMFGKLKCKIELQTAVKLDILPDTPLIGWVGRLDLQKGPEILLSAVPDICARGCQVVMLGSGDPGIEKWVRETQERFPSRFRGIVGFDVPTAHKMMAACDIIVMPSKFEPCGLNQLYALRYGTVPVVTSVGGLRDTVEDYTPFSRVPGEGSGIGWTFYPPTPAAMMTALDAALRIYYENPEAWRGVQRRAMLTDFSWDRSAEQYEAVAAWALDNPRMLESRDPWMEPAEAK